MGHYKSLLWGGPRAGLQAWAEAFAPWICSEAPTQLVIDWETGNQTRFNAWISERRRDGGNWPGAPLQQLDLNTHLHISAQQLPEVFLSVCLILPGDEVLNAFQAENLREDPACETHLQLHQGVLHLRVGQFYLQFLASERYYLASLSAVSSSISDLMTDSPSLQRVCSTIQAQANASFCALDHESGFYTPLQHPDHWIHLPDCAWGPDTLDQDIEKLLRASSRTACGDA